MKLVIKAALLVWLITIILVNPSSAQDKYSPRAVYIVRHAEKDTASDPGLSSSGLERSRALYYKLKGKGIKKVFVTQYRRTGLTAEFLCEKEGIDTVQYKADVSGEGFSKALRNYSHRTILVVGHSNTIPAIIKSLGVEPPFKELPESQYDDLFIIKYKKGKPVLRQEKYGKPSLSSGLEL